MEESGAFICALPDLYFEIMRRYGDVFMPFEKIADVRRGETTGCDDFFLPYDITADALKLEPDADDFRNRFRCQRREVSSGAVRIVRAGDGSEHPIEQKFLKSVFVPEDDIKNIEVSEMQNRQRVLWVSKTKSQLRGTHVLDYIKYGTHENFGDGAPVPEKPTCAARARENHEWYDLTDAVGTRLLMPKGQQYGNIVFCADEPMLANSRVYNVVAPSKKMEKPLAAILNSTLAALYRCLYGRSLGREGAADIMVVDVKMMPAPDPSKASEEILSRLQESLDAMGGRQIQPFLETAFAECSHWKIADAMADTPVVLPPELLSADRQQLDDAVWELIGVSKSTERMKLREQLYRELALFYRQIRILELQAMENRRRAQKGKAASPREVAQEIFEALEPALIRHFPENFLPEGETLETIELPEGKAKLFDEHDFYDAKSLAVRHAQIGFATSRASRACQAIL